LRFFGAESISAVHNFSDVGGMSVGMGEVWEGVDERRPGGKKLTRS
jgi:hypothetical protein